MEGDTQEAGRPAKRTKLFKLGSALKHSAQLPVRDSHSTGVKRPKEFPSVEFSMQKVASERKLSSASTESSEIGAGRD
jgi:hypothetical protein